MAAFAMKRSFQQRTIVLMTVFGVLCMQSIIFVLNGLHLDFSDLPRFDPHSPPVADSMFALLSTLFHLDLTLAVIGVLAAICAAIYINFGRSHLDLSRRLPGNDLLDPPDELTQTVQKFAAQAGVACPEIRIVDSGSPSAFMVRSKGKYVMALTVGLLESFDQAEVHACIAHEIAHLKNRDFLVRSLATLAKIVLFDKPLSYLIEPAVYRAREFLADKTSASLMGSPAPLISVLSKLRELNAPAVATSFGGVSSCCLNGRTSSFRLFDKHPDLNSRIQLLEEMKHS
jgi:heat shock protein HtpX